MEFGSKFVYLGNDEEDEEEVKISAANDVVLSDSDSESDDDGETCLLDILDTAGQEEYSSVRDMYVRSGHGFVIIYSITDKESFNEAEAIYSWLKRMKNEDLFAILVANKEDLASEAVVTMQEGQDLAAKLKIPFFQTSAKTGSGVEEAMTGLIKTIPRSSMDYKVVMLGSGAVGKSSITLRFVSNRFVDDYDPTIEDSYRKMVKVKGLQQMDKDQKKKWKAKSKERGGSGLAPGGIHTLMPGPPTKRGGFLHSFRNMFGAKRSAPQSQGPAPPPQQLLCPPALGIQAQQSTPMQASEKKPSLNKIKQRKTDGNVVLIPLRNLGNEPQLVTGDPIKCGHCRAILTGTSKLEADRDSKIWTCEFCGHRNSGLDISEDEIPKGDTLDYMLSPPTKPKEETDNAGEGSASETKKETTPGIIVYCMDISSSMQTVCHVPEAHAAWREERTRGAETVSQVTRLDCIRKAVQRLAEQLKHEEPDKQVLLSVFSSDFFVKGGGRTDNLPEHNQLEPKSFENLLEMGLTLSNEYPLKTIEESHDDISAAVQGLHTTGCTALGPALSICLGYVSKIPSSEIVLCTDGEPNVGVGSLSRCADTDFYQRAGEYARSKSVTINILAVEGAPVGLQTVSAAAEYSGGTTNKLNPMEIMRQLRLIAQNEVVATSVTVAFYLHPEFVFDEPDYGSNLSQLEKEVGSVRKETDLSFRFKLKDPSKNVSVSSIPFQVQINYTRKDGMRVLRVLSKSTESTTSRKDMEENINVSVLGVAAMKTTAKLAQAGKAQDAQHLLKNVKRIVKRGAKSEEQREERLAFVNETEVWDTELTYRNDQYAMPMKSDFSSNMVQTVQAMNFGRQAAVSKKASIVEGRKMKSEGKAAYYSYKDNY